MNSLPYAFRFKNVFSGVPLRNFKSFAILSPRKATFSSLCTQFKINQNSVLQLSTPFSCVRPYMKPVPNVPLPNFLDHKDMHANVWVAERFVSIGLLCSIPLVFADSSLEDLEAFVDILIALHVHWGLEAIFKDYLRPSVVGDTIPKFCDVYAGLVSIYLAVALLWISFYGTGVVKTIKHLWLLDPVIEK